MWVGIVKTENNIAKLYNPYAKTESKKSTAMKNQFKYQFKVGKENTINILINSKGRETY